jgi:hypothetical protein
VYQSVIFSLKWVKTPLRASIILKNVTLAIREGDTEGRGGDGSEGGEGRGEEWSGGEDREREGTPPVSATDLRPDVGYNN